MLITIKINNNNTLTTDTGDRLLRSLTKIRIINRTTP